VQAINARSCININRQRGLATLLALIVVGLSITGAVLGSVSYLRNAQDQTTSFHTQSQAQMNAWTGVRALYQWLDQLRSLEEPPDATALYNAFVDASASGSTNLIAGSQDLAAYVVDVSGDPSGFRVTANVHGISLADVADVRSTAIIQVVFYLEEQPFTESEGLQSVISFNRGLTLAGNISVQSTPGESYEINIQGFFDTGGNSITGIDTIRATDSVRITSGSNFRNIFSNGDVRLEGSVTISDSIQARGNVCLPGGATASSGLTRSEGFVYGSGSANFHTVEARGESLYDGTLPLCANLANSDTHGNLIAVNLAGNSNANTIDAIGSVNNNGGSVNVRADGDYHNGHGSGTGEITGTPRYCPNAVCQAAIPAWKANDINVVTNANLVVDIPGVPPVEVAVSGFDAYNYRASANYAFSVDEDGFMRVTVRNVTGIPNSDYYLGSYAGPYKDRLCNALTAGSTPQNPTCALPANGADSYPMCWGYSAYNNCFSYNAGSETWAIVGNSIAQGVVWFEGNLNAGSGTYYNTFIVTGNLATSGSHQAYAPNFAGYSGAVDGVTYAPKGMCSNSISPHRPSQLCVDGSFNATWANGLANFVYMAGSYDESQDYVGGDITLGASTQAFGSILAGNDYSSGGSTTVAGYITALAQRGTGSSSMGGSTSINLVQLPPTYQAQAGDPSTGGGGSSGGPFTIALQWARYL